MKFFISDQIFTPKIMTNDLIQLYDNLRKRHVICIVFAHQGLQKPHSVLRYPVGTQKEFFIFTNSEIYAVKYGNQ